MRSVSTPFNWQPDFITAHSTVDCLPYCLTVDKYNTVSFELPLIRNLNKRFQPLVLGRGSILQSISARVPDCATRVSGPEFKTLVTRAYNHKENVYYY